VPTEVILPVVLALIGGLLLIGAVIAVRRGDGDPLGVGPHADDAAPPHVLDKYALAEPMTRRALGEGVAGRNGAYGRAVRVAWWISIAAMLVGIGISGAFRENHALIYAIGALAVAVVVVLHELVPDRWRIPGRAWIEATIAIALISAVVLLTGRASSPFVIAYPIVTVGVALARGARAALVLTLLASLAYVAVIDDLRSILAGQGEALRVGANVLGIWLVTALAAAYASQERRARSAVVQLSQTDPLTGLFNRSQIVTAIDQEVRRTRRSERGFCILMIDLDGLKAVNDSAGHHRGDDVLRSLGSIIRRSIRTVDSAYRYGGDEFVVLLPETDIIGAFVVAEKIRAGAEEMSPSLGIEGVETSVSIGLVSHPEDGLSVEELMIAADRAMYQAKTQGKNQISGFPRPRRIIPSLPAPVEPPPPVEAAAQPEAALEPDTGVAQAAPEPSMSAAEAAEPPSVVSAEAPIEPAATSPLRPVEVGPGGTNGAREGAVDEEEPDPSEVRRQIAAAARSFDPDHQIRRAMDAFLGPAPPDSQEH
jgi:diguanylate cyclase (GGDEF)-like protein